MTEHVVGPALPDLATLVLDGVLRFRVKRHHRSAEVTSESLRRSAAWFQSAMKAGPLPPFVTVEPARVGRVEGEWLATGLPTRGVILYFHGGGFYMCSPKSHRALTWRLARATGRKVCAIAYRKAPDHAFPTWVDDAAAAFRGLLEQGYRPSDIVLAGDSAGGNLALAVTHRFRREKAPLPAALILFSPWADLACEGGSYRTNARRDAMFHATAIRSLGAFLTRGGSPRDPESSPVYADLRGFPPMLLFAGSTEVFLDDARAVAQHAETAGVQADLYIYRHMPHVFPIFADVLPRARSAFDIIESFAP